MKRLLYLDIDGVLNDHTFDEVAQSCGIKRECIKHLNKIVRDTGCEIVLSSAWRYMMPTAMNLDGFWYMMRTHGFTAADRNPFVAYTRRDKWPNEPRAKQIIEDYMEWKQGHGDVRFCILDDLDLGFRESPLTSSRFVQTDGMFGMMAYDAERAIQILTEEG